MNFLSALRYFFALDSSIGGLTGNTCLEGVLTGALWCTAVQSGAVGLLLVFSRRAPTSLAVIVLPFWRCCGECRLGAGITGTGGSSDSHGSGDPSKTCSPAVLQWCLWDRTARHNGVFRSCVPAHASRKKTLGKQRRPFTQSDFGCVHAAVSINTMASSKR